MRLLLWMMIDLLSLPPLLCNSYFCSPCLRHQLNEAAGGSGEGTGGVVAV